MNKENLLKSTILFSLLAVLMLLLPVLQYFSSQQQFAYATTLSDFSFGTAGDWSSKTSALNTATNMKNHGVVKAIGIGDYAYLTGTSAVDSWWKKEMYPVHGIWKGSEGNHDTQDSAEYLKLFGQSSWVFSFNYQNVRFISLDTEISYGVGSSQYNFVKNDLASASTNTAINWIIAFFHRPIYTSPSVHAPLAAFRDVYHPLFDKYHVDLVLQGHNHNYQRSYPLLYNSNSPSNPTITTKNTTNYSNPNGEIYMVVGTGGQTSYAFNAQAAYIVKQFTNTFGFLDIDIINNGSTLKGTFFSDGGVIKDQFTITKYIGTSVTPFLLALPV